jgi:hypothetical protein
MWNYDNGDYTQGSSRQTETGLLLNPVVTLIQMHRLYLKCERNFVQGKLENSPYYWKSIKMCPNTVLNKTTKDKKVREFTVEI